MEKLEPYNAKNWPKSSYDFMWECIYDDMNTQLAHSYYCAIINFSGHFY